MAKMFLIMDQHPRTLKGFAGESLNITFSSLIKQNLKVYIMEIEQHVGMLSREMSDFSGEEVHLEFATIDAGQNHYHF